MLLLVIVHTFPHSPLLFFSLSLFSLSLLLLVIVLINSVLLPSSIPCLLPTVERGLEINSQQEVNQPGSSGALLSA